MDDERKRIRDALADIEAQLKEDRDFGPHFTTDDHKNIAATKEHLERRLASLNQDKEEK